MSTTTIHPPTSQGAHAGRPAGDPQESIHAIRQAVSGVAELERELADALADLATLSSALKARDALAAELGLRLVRAEEALADLADHAYRLERENGRLSAENRLLRDEEPLYGGRHRRWGR